MNRPKANLASVVIIGTVAVVAIGCIRISSRAVVSDHPAVPQRDAEAVRSQLAANYPAPTKTGRQYAFQDGEAKFYYVADWTVVEPAESESIVEYLPGVRFYQTSLYWLHYGPGETKILVALHDDAEEGAIAASPFYSQVTPNFLQWLRSYYAPGPGGRSGFVNALAQTYITIMSSAEIRAESCDETCCYAELGRTERRYDGFTAPSHPLYQLDVCFDGDTLLDIQTKRLPRYPD